MRVFEAALGIAIVLSVLWDAFETLVLPRRVTRKFRLARGFYLSAWGAWSAIARRMQPGKLRDLYLSIFGPLSLLFLFMLWAAGLVFGFALLHSAAGGAVAATGEPIGFLLDLYLSGTTFFTLGLGDVTPRTTVDRVITVVESGMGFGFLALIIGYLPILYQGFSRREITISLMDARAGSPPSASELLRRFGREERRGALHELLREWERWSAEVLESHLSYPVLVYFRSQHDNQSWLGTLTTILDTCALCMVALEKQKNLQARLTFAMARHAVTDIAQTLNARPQPVDPDRLPAAELERLRAALAPAGLCVCGQPDTDERLRELRQAYEPYVNGLAQRLLLSLPPWSPQGEAHYNWRTTAWQRSLEGAAAKAAVDEADDHS
jgi:hypothetical protein